jgi:hypothetical protein
MFAIGTLMRRLHILLRVRSFRSTRPPRHIAPTPKYTQSWMPHLPRTTSLIHKLGNAWVICMESTTHNSKRARALQTSFYPQSGQF